MSKSGRVKLEPTPNYHTVVDGDQVVESTEPKEEVPEVIEPTREVTQLQRRGANAGKIVSKVVEGDDATDTGKE